MIAVITSCGSNISSVLFALKRLGYTVEPTIDPVAIRQASHVILPGVGFAAYAMQRLKHDLLINTIKNLKQPVLGICLGMHLLFEHSAEGNVDCLGLIPGKIDQLQPQAGLTVPHMGWNRLQWQQPNHPLTHDIDDDAYVYFVHSFYAPVTTYTIASSHHGQMFSAIISKDNFHAMQFHPERSGKIGEQLLRNFLAL